MKKKKIPIALLKGLEPVIQENLDVIKFVDEPETVYSFYDKDNQSDLYFKILTAGTEKSKPYGTIKRQPRHRTDLGVYQTTLQPDQVVQSFKEWVGIIREYNDTNSVLDDPILKAYQDEFFQKYQILDKDADTEPFNLNQQLLLDKYLDTVVKKIDKYKTKETEAEVADIIEEVTILKDELTTLSKNQTMKRLSRLWAKSRKSGLDAFKLFWQEAVKQLGKEVIQNLLN